MFKEICVENYKEFNGVNFSSRRARTNVLASLILKAGFNKLAIAINSVIMMVSVCMSAKK